MIYERRNDVLVIGAGHGGCQVVDAIAQREICEYLFVDSSIGDLNTLCARPQFKLHFRDGYGCAADREMGKQFTKENMEEVFRCIDSTNASHIYIVAALAGGTGSGSAIEMAQQIGKRYHPTRTQGYRTQQSLSGLPDRLVHIIGIVPGQYDNIGSIGYKNSLEFLKELTDLYTNEYICSYTFIDNGANSDKLELNEQFAADFKEFLSVPEKTNCLGKEISLMDMKKSMSTRGMFQFVEFSLTEQNPSTVNIHSNNYFPNFTKGCKYLITTSSSHNEEYVPNIIDYFGKPLEQIKCGTSVGPRSMAFAFGMEFPILVVENLMNTYKEYLHLVEMESNKPAKFTEIL